MEQRYSRRILQIRGKSPQVYTPKQENKPVSVIPFEVTDTRTVFNYVERQETRQARKSDVYHLDYVDYEEEIPAVVKVTKVEIDLSPVVYLVGQLTLLSVIGLTLAIPVAICVVVVGVGWFVVIVVQRLSSRLSSPVRNVSRTNPMRTRGQTTINKIVVNGDLIINN